MALFARRGDIENTRHLLNEAERHEVDITMPMLDMVVQWSEENGIELNGRAIYLKGQTVFLITYIGNNQAVSGFGSC